MKTKFYSVLLSFCVLLGMTVLPAFAADGYTVNYYGEGENRTAEQTQEYVFDGDYALLVKYSGTTKNTANYIEVKLPAEEMLAGDYTLSFYNKGKASSFTEISVSDRHVYGYSDMTKTDATAPSGETGWSKYSVSFTYQGQAEDFVAFRFYGATSKAAIDSISVTATGGTENLLTGGDFEDYQEQPEEAWDTTGYKPVNIMSVPYVGGIALSWTNPSAVTLSDIAIYDITDGEELITDEINTSAGKLINYEFVTDADKAYQFKIVFKYSDKEDFIYFLADKPAASGSNSNAYTLGTWTLSQALHGKAGYTPAEAMIDHDVKYGESGGSLKLVSNIDRSRSDMNGNTYINVYTDLPMKTGKTYKISFMQKSLNVVKTPQVNMNGTKFDGEGLEMPYTGTKDWTLREYTYTCTGSVRLRLMTEGACEGLWFDNIEVYELDENGEPTGENLLPDGNFDGLQSEIVGTLSDVSATAGKDSITISYSAPSKNCSDINIYEKKFDNFEYRGKLSVQAGSVAITGLEQDTEYTYMLCPVNADVFEGEGTVVTVKTILPDYEVFEPTLVTDSITGISTAIVEVKNNAIDDGVNVELIAGVYKDGALETVYSEKALVPKTAKNKKPEKISFDMEIPEESGYSVRLYVIDSRDSLDIFYPCKIY